MGQGTTWCVGTSTTQNYFISRRMQCSKSGKKKKVGSVATGQAIKYIISNKKKYFKKIFIAIQEIKLDEYFQ
jgi:ribose 5-phosphate isomerase